MDQMRPRGTSLLPASGWNDLRREMHRLFGDFLGESWFDDGGVASTGSWAPSLDICETDKEVAVRVEIPGVDPKKVDISTSGNTLTIAGQKEGGREGESERYYRAERRLGSFRRTIELPSCVDASSVSAEHANGVLTITFKKSAEATTRRIPVTAK